MVSHFFKCTYEKLIWTTHTLEWRKNTYFAPIKTWTGAFFRFLGINTGVDWEKRSVCLLQYMSYIDTDLSMEYKKEYETYARHMLSLWNFKSHNHSYQTLCFTFSPLSVINEDHNNHFPLTKSEEFSNSCSWEICSELLITCPYIWNY